MFQKPGLPQANECRDWVSRHIANGVRVVVPEIVNYELRRELLRLNHARALRSLAAFVRAVPDRYVPITSAALERAAELWAQARQGGKPTAHPQALDIDVILAAQVLSAGFNPADFIVATSNVSHLALFVPADEWRKVV